jgi:nitrite reductase/ring-hydroxylating ferredoxin subunit
MLKNASCNFHLFRLIFPLFFSLLIFSTFSCGKEETRDQIPYVYVNFPLYVNTLDYVAEGQYIYVSGGYKGIIIYRPIRDEFLAYERACPHDPLKEGARVKVDESGLIAVDSLCGSKFILTDGSPIEGPAGIALKQYRTHYDGHVLMVYN